MSLPAVEPRQFIALGINHKTAPVAMREKVAFTPSQLQEACRQLRGHQSIKEVALLSTCNRTEIYCLTNSTSVRPVLDWLASFHNLPLEDVIRYSYIHEDQAAISHLMRVAAGLDSMLLGEPQILGQVKDSYDLSKKEGLLGANLELLFQQVFSSSKQIRSQTSIGEHPVSVAFAAVSLAQKIFTKLTTSQALLVGAGETIELVARHLKNAGVQKLVIANRSIENGQKLAEEVGGKAVALKAIPEELVHADIVITSTAAPLPILGKGMIERALKARRYQPIFMVDIAVPRDIEPEVGQLNDIYLYTVDDLKEVIEENLSARKEAAKEAEIIISQNVEKFIQALRVKDAGHIIRLFRQKAQTLAEAELQEALKQLELGQPAEEILPRLVRNLTNKWLHDPTLKLRQASASNETGLLDAATELMNLNKP